MDPQILEEKSVPSMASISKMENIQEKLTFLTAQLGDFGKYHSLQHLLHCLVWLISGIHMMGFVFVFPIMEHRCYIPQIDNNSEFSIGEYIPTTASGKLASCSKFKVPNQDNSTLPCGENGYVYSSNYYASSRVREWDMVCEREWMRAILQSIFILGALFGSLVGGTLGDKFGRKPGLFCSGVLSLLCGFGAVFFDNFYVAAVFMLFYGVFGAGSGNACSLTLTMELVGSSKRTICGSAITFAFGLGGIVVVGVAYLLPVNARTIHFIYVCCSLPLFANWWLVDESISWLWGQGKYDEATNILEKAAKMNGIKLTFPEGLRRPTTDLKRRDTEDDFQREEKYIPEKEPGIVDVFRTPEIRKRTLIMMFVWFSGGMLYFGFCFNSVNLFGNPFLVFIITCLAELPCHPITIFLTPKLGHKPMLCASFLLSGIICVVLAIIPRGIVSTFIAMFAKIPATAFYNIANAYTAELFPTVSRNTAMGLCIMAARVGASLIPQINLLAVISDKLPDLIFGAFGIMAGVAVLLLPETMNKPIPQTIQDLENYKKRKDEQQQPPNSNVIWHREDSISLL